MADREDISSPAEETGDPSPDLGDGMVGLDLEDELAADEAFDKKVPTWVKALIIVGLVLVFLFSFCIGRYGISLPEVFSTVWNHFFDPDAITDENMERSLFNVRLPRILVVMIVGAGLSVAGASYQGMFKNPLTSPDLLGASAGASLGAGIAIIAGFPNIIVQLMAFVGGLVAVGCAVGLTQLVKYDAILSLVLAGILVSSLFNAGMSLVKLLADSNSRLPELTYWLMGSFNDVNTGDLLLLLIPSAIAFAILLSQAWKLNVLSFGDEEARSMGINTNRTRLLVILASTLLTSISVSVAGVIGWVGLVIPHLARAIVGPNYKVLLPTSMALGAGFLVLVDDVARNLMAVEVPIGILTAILGVPFFVVIFKNNMKGWG